MVRTETVYIIIVRATAIVVRLCHEFRAASPLLVYSPTRRPPFRRVRHSVRPPYLGDLFPKLSHRHVLCKPISLSLRLFLQSGIVSRRRPRSSTTVVGRFRLISIPLQRRPSPRQFSQGSFLPTYPSRTSNDVVKYVHICSPVPRSATIPPLRHRRTYIYIYI